MLSNEDVLVDLYERLFRRRKVGNEAKEKGMTVEDGEGKGDGGERQAEMQRRFGDVQSRDKLLSLVQERTVGLK